MLEWWDSLTFLQQLFYYCAIPSTFILVLQTVLSIFGIGNGDADADADVDVDMDADFDDIDVSHDVDIDSDSLGLEEAESATSLRFFSIRGIIAFFSLFGWVGVVLSGTGMNIAIIIFIAFLSGLLGMLIIALLFYSITKLQYNGNKNVKNAIGQIGQVYIPIPPNMSGKGKIQVTFQETLTEMNAMTETLEVLPTGSMVLVIDVIDENTLLVEKQ